TSDPGILGVGDAYFSLIGPSYPFVGVSMVLAFAFQGLGRATAPLAVMATRVPLVLGVAIACTRWLGLRERSVFATIAAGNVLAAVVLGVAFLRVQARLTPDGRARGEAGAGADSRVGETAEPPPLEIA
ncbi:MAG: hypothetical protein ACKOCT_16230, partial [Alphaproteobacteria bacterium]